MPAPAARTPWQLPPTVKGFVNRDHELGMLSKLSNAAESATGPTVAVLSGLAGVGKTATCVRWGHQHRQDFDGGQLYVNFADYPHRGGVDVSAVLGAFLRALGIHDHYIPVDLPERAALFRTRTSTHRMLIMLDNVQQPAQVRPLLPGSGPSMVLVTSRKRLSGLLVDGASLVNLKPLGRADGARVVTQSLAPGLRCPDNDALSELVTLCGGLPLALRVAAARLSQHGRWTLRRLVTYLSDEQHRLSRLSTHDDHTLQSVLDIAYNDLPQPARHAYHAIGIHPGPDFDLHMAAFTLDLTPEAVDDQLEVLTEASLLDNAAPDRYRPHDLVRLHARQRAQNALPPETQQHLAHRIIDWYLSCAAAADIAVLGTSRWRLAEHDLAKVPFAFDASTAMIWFENERANLLAAVHLASVHGCYDAVWQLCEALWALYYSKKYYADWIEAYELGARAAHQMDNAIAEARMLNQLARARIELGDFAQAEADLTTARNAAANSPDQRAVATVTESLGVLHREQGHYAEAIAEFQQSRDINVEVGDQRGVALQEYHIAGTLVRYGKPRDALASITVATALFHDLRDELAQARLQIIHGQALHALGRDHEAAGLLRAAADTSRRRHQVIKELQALEILTEVTEQGTPEHDRATTRVTDLHDLIGSPARRPTPNDDQDEDED